MDVKHHSNNSNSRDSYYIRIENAHITVSSDIFRYYRACDITERSKAHRRSKREVSLEKLMEDDSYTLPDYEHSVEQIVLRRLMIEELVAALRKLDKRERQLIHALFFKEHTQKHIAAQEGVTPSAIRQRKDATIQKLRCILKEL